MAEFPICFYPTSVVLIDDHKPFVDSLSFSLNNKYSSFKTYSNPIKALDYLSNYKPEPFTDRLSDYLDESNMVMDLSILHQEIYYPERFNQISVVITDYIMPEITGLDICAKIQDPSIKKILVTGIGDEKVAVDAFNKGLIDYYVRKHDPQLISLLDDYIYKAQKSYFTGLSKPFFQNRIKDSAEVVALNDRAFQDFFVSLLNEKDVTEYYFLDTMGSCLFLDEQGSPSALFVRTKEQLSQELDLWKELLKDETTVSLSPGIIAGLKNYSQMLCYHYFKNMPHPDVSVWEQYLAPVHHFEGEHKYYYAYIPTVENLLRKGILSYEDFLKSGH